MAQYNVILLVVMQNGTIARVMDKGYGFIAIEGQDKDLFFHANELQGVEFNDLKEGDAVTFETQETPKGMQAVNVQPAEGGAAAPADEDDMDMSDDSDEMDMEMGE